jgi:alkanesulfonate monooxygenase SsuD/methylene tetrahydromethanopterin reductase-like flavin-dependent oxidoreductase (luciferase family)
MLEASGFGAEGERIRQAFGAGDHEAMIEAVSDEMLDAMGVAGTPEQVRAGIARREEDFDHLSLYSPSFTMTLERVQQNTLELIRVGAPRAQGDDDRRRAA